jgi:multiple sugar transport system ATP-binding protein
MSGVKLDQVRKVYDNAHVAVADASFEVLPGELLVLVGPSGCGKSTLLRMIAGLESITSGTLSIDGRVVNEIAPKDRDIAMVFQNYALYPHMNVAENLGFGLRLRGQSKPEIARRVAEAAHTLGLTDVLERRPAALSGGQRQRVALGRALVREPKVFLLDEPLSNLDAKLRHSMRVEIARLHRDLGATMVYVTHDQIEAMTLGQRIVVLKDGEIQQIDAPMMLYAKPANVFVAGFLGTPSMNLLRGRFTDEDQSRFETGGIAIELGKIRLAAPLSLRGKDIMLGVRPEDLHVADEPSSPDSPRARVDIVEPVGNEAFLHLRLGDHSLVSRQPAARLPVQGQDVWLRFDSARLHFFDGASGRRIETDNGNA